MLPWFYLLALLLPLVQTYPAVRAKRGPSMSSDRIARGAPTRMSRDDTGPTCVTSCKGRKPGDYQSCLSCHVYVTCINGIKKANRPCPDDLVWSDKDRKCSSFSLSCHDPSSVAIGGGQSGIARPARNVRSARHDGGGSSGGMDGNSMEGNEMKGGDGEGDEVKDGDDEEGGDEVGDDTDSDVIKQGDNEEDGDEKGGEIEEDDDDEGDEMERGEIEEGGDPEGEGYEGGDGDLDADDDGGDEVEVDEAHGVKADDEYVDEIEGAEKNGDD